MRVPPRKEGTLPKVVDIGLEGETIHIVLSEKADSIRVNGQDHATLKLVQNTENCEYALRPEDPYARFTAFFPDGSVIYSNPFARYDASIGLAEPEPPVDIPGTVLYNLLLLCLAILWLRLMRKLFKR